MGHFAISDIDGSGFVARERFARGAAGLAGARAEPLKVWLEGWALDGSGSGDGFPFTLFAEDDSIAIDLVLSEGKGIVLNGDRGLSQKGTEPGNASYYYSLPRMPTSGSVRVGSERFDVVGESWLDREWSTSLLGDAQVGWDWFSLQLDDGRELMVFRIRRADGSAAAESEGVLIDRDARSTRLAWGTDIQVEELSSWKTPDGTADYPSMWIIRIPEEELELEIEPLLADQELRLAFRYWEGAVRISGSGPEGPVSGRGYVELTGYGGSGPNWR
jgi:predicted secreted hydrolase